MALSSSLNDVIICVILLYCVPSSLQNCPQTVQIQQQSVEEGPASKGIVLYSISGITNLTLTNDGNGYLAVNTTQNNGSTTFHLYIAKEIDYEVQRNGINGQVRCFDSTTTTGYTYAVVVPITGVNEFPPEFKKSNYSANVTENSPSGASVFSFYGEAEDKDYTLSAVNIVYSIVNNTSPFAIPDSGQGTVTVSGNLNYETGPPSYILNISAAERTGIQPLTGYTTLTIHVIDIDDVGPEFTYNASYKLSIPEGKYSNTIFWTEPTIFAQDGDSHKDTIQLDLDPTSEALRNTFTVKDNGSIAVTGTLNPRNYTINIRAYQTNRPSDRFAVTSVLVTVYDINDHAPQMDRASYTGRVQEGALPDTVVLTVTASDPDQGVNGSFQFHLNDSTTPFNVTTVGSVGFVIVSDQLDRETAESYTLFVYAQEDQSKDQQRSNSSVVTITVLDVNDNTPVFHGTPYAFSVNETDTAGHIVGRVNATDADKDDNAIVTYDITTTGGVADAFKVNQSTGIIFLSRDLNQSDAGVVYLDLKAEDSASNGLGKRSQSTQVQITIQSVNEFPPAFTAPSFTFSVPETVPVGFSIGEIGATDNDGDALNYMLTSAGSDFKLQGNPPRLTVNGSLDLDVTGSPYSERTFQVVVSDGLHSDTSTVLVNVTMVNEFTPVMNQSVYTANVRENDPKGHQILKLNATDGDAGPDGQLRFSITSQDGTKFTLNSTSGVLSLNCDACLDFNNRNLYTLVVQVADGGTPPKSSVSTVIISVEDVNNKAPRFTVGTITGTVSEDAESGTTVLQLQAMDDDTASSGLIYSLENLTPAGWLRVDGNALVTSGSLDAESARFITGSVRVSDGVQNNTAALNITVEDVNDNFPQIQLLPSDTVNIPENATLGTDVAKVTAQDRDVTASKDFFFYLGSTPSGKFAINSSSGEITVAAPFDRRIQKEYDVTVSVSDNSAPPKRNSTILHVVITDSNSAPEFVDSRNASVAVYNFNVIETEAVGFVIGQVKALDPDSGSSGDVRYSLQSGSDMNKFRLDPSTGELLLMEKLDYEKKDKYSLTINATDNSFEPKWSTVVVMIIVQNVVEAPQWPGSLPVVHLTANQQCGDVQLDARPQDLLQTSTSYSQSGVVYSLLNYTDDFSINNETGLLQRKRPLSVNTYVIGLRACSAKNVTVCSDTALTVQVSAGDVITFCPPFFTVNVNESVEIGHVVVDLNSTKNDSNITYSLTTANVPFLVNASTGVITVREKLDRETTAVYTLAIVAVYRPSNGSAIAQVTVVVEDAPDTAPKFQLQQYDGEVSEAAGVGQPVLTLGGARSLRVAADDADLQPVLIYSIEPGSDNSNGSFAVNSTTGEITVARPINLESMAISLNGQYTFKVMATDSYQNDNATVYVRVLNVNDESPVFASDSYNITVNEAVEPPYIVGTLIATDGDGDALSYSLLPSGASLPFSIGTTGELQLNQRLNRQSRDMFSFTVVARDGGGRNGTAQVTITVGDANEPPVFNNATYVFHITEGPGGIGSEMIVSATDNDLGQNAALTFDITSGDPTGAFNITTFTNSTAVLRLIKELDRETATTVRLTLRAMDKGQPPLSATCTVEVMIDDVNDNAPKFGAGRYTADVSEGAKNNTRLTLNPSFSLTDADGGIFGRRGVVYRLTNRESPPVPFRVDPATGDLFVSLDNNTDHLDREVTPKYTLILVATDNNGNGLNGSTTVVVSLTNINDHAPAFLQNPYHFNVTEDVALRHVVGTLNATDSDSNSSVIAFYIYPPGGEGKFYLDPVSGKLLVSGLLDRETKDHYSLSLGVFDGVFWGNATASITVEDVNDNCPVFNNEQPLKLTVMENTNVSIHTFNVTDNDLGSNGHVTLFINGTAADRYLTLTPAGELWTKQPLDREKDDQHTLVFTVWAKDGGSPACTTSLQVQVQVQGANEENPHVCQITRQQQPVCDKNISVIAFTGASEGTFLVALTWRDYDDGEGGQAELSLSEDPDGLFSLNQTTSGTSILTLAKMLDVDDLIAKGMLGGDNATYVAEITARDKGTQPRNSSVALTLKVLKLLPTTPIFANSVYNFSVPENQLAAVVGSVKASTANGTEQMNYTLQSTQDFAVDSLGQISTVGKLDREAKELYTFLVLAWDSPRLSDTASAVVLVTVQDENDNTPKFSASVYDVTVPENVKDRELMTLVATDNDAGVNGRVTFTLLNTSLSDVFVLNSTTGLLWLNQSLDREQNSSYTLVVQAADGAATPRVSVATVRITVQDVNDNPPLFTQNLYSGYLDENSPAATLVEKVNVLARDLDSGLNGQVLYTLSTRGASQSLSTDFYINEFSGAIYTSRSFSYKTEHSFNLTVTARDLGTPSLTSSANVIIYVNDLSSVLPQLTLDPESVALVLGTPANTLLPVNISAGFGRYNFSILEGNDENLFHIDPNTGDITVIGELTQTREYLLTIRVFNLNATQYFVDGKLSVIVTSVKLEQEKYAAVLAENTPPPYLILDINSNAERAGIPVTYTLTMATASAVQDAFNISGSTGQLYCVKTLDREIQAEYRMSVSVELTYVLNTGRGKRELSNAAEIVVIVGDENDNPPHFDFTSNIFGIPSSAAAFTVVTTIKAVDPDFGVNGELRYQALRGDTDVFFVTPEGEVTSLVPMDDKEGPFTLVVNATDKNGAGQSAMAEIKIVVVSNSDRFGLVANITVNMFTARQQFYLRNLSAILNMTLQLDKVEPHQGSVIDTSKSDIYFYAFDNNSKPIPFSVIDERVKANAEAINALFNLNSVQLIPVTETPTLVRIQTKYEMGEAEIAVIVVACLIFLVSFIAIILTFRAWKKQKEFQRREEAAVRARQRLEQETQELADKMQETSFRADPEEPLELDMDPEDEGRVFNPRMFLKNMRESEYRPHRRPQELVTEDQECVMNFGNESSGLDTVALRHAVLRQTEASTLDVLLEEDGHPREPMEADSGTEINGGSLSSEEHQQSERATHQGESSGSATDEATEGSSADSVSNSFTSPADSQTQPGADSSDNSLLGGDLAEVRHEENQPLPEDTNELVSVKSKTEDHENNTDLTQQRDGLVSSPSPSLDTTAATTSQTETTENDDPPRQEDPEPDYQKRVSFSDVLDDQKDDSKPVQGSLGTPKPIESNTNYLDVTTKLLEMLKAKRREREGFVNPAYTEDATDGWAADYGEDDQSVTITAL